ncbi:hypothetical protein AZF37_00965 [endosymbiont 'TC1' of Trimyema compressum]|uniref:phosphatidylglycerol lysyltransferase domain-containing protein n=1 Tax=endosymbiont 'TC1' of Trimyema compressum TaxID=243899 RepID=UPI0007F04CA9|nr:phosphatidylglycerol lysyltransferase domain-containing protein [endosymbiont 'TC1' of Trimyema compressum]AMP19939.1 hypothetical protein AZF37_00965 [endosymbiont 'TC1' of Trimyema compressum]
MLAWACLHYTTNTTNTTKKNGESKLCIERFFNFVYRKINGLYDFKALHFAKEKYNPNYWEERYIAYSGSKMSFSYMLVIVKIHMQHSLLFVLIYQIYSLFFLTG